MPRALVLLALALAVAVAALTGEERAAPRASATASSGALTHQNSRDGAAIFSSSSLAPGRSAFGSVTIRNSGEVPGLFRVTQSAPVGALGASVQLLVRDATGGRTVYQGPLAGMGAREAGRIEPGDSRTYEFAAGLPAALSLNGLQATSASVGYVWTARAAPAPAPPLPARPRDGTPPRVRLKVPRRQRILRRRYVIVLARCDEACSLRARGRWRVGRTRTVTSLVGGRRTRAHRWVRLQIGMNRRLRRPLSKALLRDRPATLLVTLTARDRAENVRVLRRRILFRRAR